jgi:hypothetical protein
MMESEFIIQRQNDLNKKIVMLSRLLNLDSKKKIIESHLQHDSKQITNFGNDLND